MKRIFRQGRYANVTATLALVVAMSGTSYAAISVTSKHVKNGSLTGVDIKNNSIRSADVSGLSATDFAAGAVPQGPAGRPGPVGPHGAKGDPGAKGDRGAPGSALAYAHVRADATLNPARSTGVTEVARMGHPPQGAYCLYGNFTPKVATMSVAPVDVNVIGNEVVTQLALGSDTFFGFGLSSCPPRSTPAVAAVFVLSPNSGQGLDRPFYIQFN